MQMVETEKREVPRRTTLKGGHIAFNGGRSTIDCTVRNLSSKGAKLKVASILGVPDTFELVLQDGSKQSCRVIWRTAGELGVEFTFTAGP